MLLCSSVHREDGQLVELDAVHERQPWTNTRAFVWTSVHTNPGVLGVHLVDNPVPLSSQITNDKTMEHFISLPGFSNRDTFLGFEDFFLFGKQLLPNFLHSFCLVFREIKKRIHFFLTSTEAWKAFPVWFHLFLLNDAKDGNDVDEVLFVVPVPKSGHLEVGSIWHLDLDLLGFLPLV